MLNVEILKLLLGMEMKLFNSNRSFCIFYLALPKSLFILKMSNREPFRYQKLKLSSQMDSGGFVKIRTQLGNSEFLIKLKYAITRKFQCY